MSAVSPSSRTWGLQNDLGNILTILALRQGQWVNYFFGRTRGYLMNYFFSALRERPLSGAGGLGEEASPTPRVSCAHQPTLATTTTTLTLRHPFRSYRQWWQCLWYPHLFGCTPAFVPLGTTGSGGNAFGIHTCLGAHPRLSRWGPQAVVAMPFGIHTCLGAHQCLSRWGLQPVVAMPSVSHTWLGTKTLTNLANSHVMRGRAFSRGTLRADPRCPLDLSKN